MKEDEYLPSYKAMKETIDELNLNKTHSHGDFHMKNMVYDANSGGFFCGIMCVNLHYCNLLAPFNVIAHQFRIFN